LPQANSINRVALESPLLVVQEKPIFGNTSSTKKGSTKWFFSMKIPSKQVNPPTQAKSKILSDNMRDEENLCGFPKLVQPPTTPPPAPTSHHANIHRRCPNFEIGSLVGRN